MREILANCALLAALLVKVAVATGLGPAIAAAALWQRLRRPVAPIRKMPQPLPFPLPRRKPPQRAATQSSGFPPAA